MQSSETYTDTKRNGTSKPVDETTPIASRSQRYRTTEHRSQGIEQS